MAQMAGNPSAESFHLHKHTSFFGTDNIIHYISKGLGLRSHLSCEREGSTVTCKSCDLHMTHNLHMTHRQGSVRLPPLASWEHPNRSISETTDNPFPCPSCPSCPPPLTGQGGLSAWKCTHESGMAESRGHSHWCQTTHAPWADAQCSMNACLTEHSDRQ